MALFYNYYFALSRFTIELDCISFCCLYHPFYPCIISNVIYRYIDLLDGKDICKSIGLDTNVQNSKFAFSKYLTPLYFTPHVTHYWTCVTLFHIICLLVDFRQKIYPDTSCLYTMPSLLGS